LDEIHQNNITYKTSIQTKEDIKKYGNLPVPMIIRNAPTKLMKDLWYGSGYKYAYDQVDKRADNQHFPDELQWRKYG